jgi:DNA polymerase I
MHLEELRRFSHVWLIDFEFTQPKGSGERPVLICLSARDYLTKQRLDLNATQLHPGHPPFDIEHSLFVAYAARAEMSCFKVLGWPIPPYILDLNIEYRHFRNDGRQHPRRLIHALDHFNLPTIGADEKDDMIALATRGAPFTAAEMHALQDYCASDTAALARLLPVMAPHIDLLYALVRGRFTGCVAEMEHVGIPIDLELLTVLRERWGDIRNVFVGNIQRYWDLFDDGKLNRAKFQRYIDSLRIPYWPRTPNGWYRRDKDTLRDMAAIYADIQRLREAIDFLGQVRGLQLAVGRDGRNRTPLWPSSTKTMRCAPSSTEFLFGLPAWLRCLAQPPEGAALAYLDFRQEEPAIAACWSGDPAMTHGYQVGGDLYVDFAQRGGAIPSGLSAKAAKRQYRRVRDQYKICLLASMYGQQEQSLASRMGRSPLHAAMLLEQLRRAYPRFIAWIDNEIDCALVRGYMQSRLGWTLQTKPETRETSLLNYPMQVTGSEILQRAVWFAQRAGVRVCCTVHDALLIEAPVSEIAHHAWVTREAMRRASADILSGFDLFIDGWGEHSTDDFIQYPDHYCDPRGAGTWAQLTDILGEEWCSTLSPSAQSL